MRHLGEQFDVIVVGARCGGAPLAMLLARRGLRVLVVDRARFPSARPSTHLIWPPGGAALKRWGLLESVLSQGAVRCGTSLSISPMGEMSGPWHSVDGIDYSINLRRIALDQVLIDAARAAGADVRERVHVEGLLFEDGQAIGVTALDVDSGFRFRERARLVVGADGFRSRIASSGGAILYDDFSSQTASFYGYYSDLCGNRDVDEAYRFPPYEVLIIPTDGDLTIVNVVIPRSHLLKFQRNFPGGFQEILDRIPDVGPRVREAQLQGRLAGATDLPNFYRKPFGPGWALVGDASHHRDPIRAQGMHEAFLEAESLAETVSATWNHEGAYEIEMAQYELRRNQRTYYPYLLCLAATQLEGRANLGADANLMFDAIVASPQLIAEYRGLFAGSVQPETFYRRLVANLSSS